MEIRERVERATHFLKRELPLAPRLALQSFVGAEPFLGSLKVHAEIGFAEVPGFVTSAQGARRLFAAELGHGEGLLFLDAGPLPYDGATLAQSCVPIWTLARLGCRTLVLLNAALGLDPELRAGDLFAATDHLDFFHDHPLQGHAHAELGPRFPDMSVVYDPGLIATLRTLAAQDGIALREGVLAGRPGPAGDTPAELRYVQGAGAAAVARTAVPEAIAARHAGVRTCALSAITEVKPPPFRGASDLEAIVTASEQASRRMARLVARFAALPAERMR
jgi:purine-nucleoside phosphorylase